MDSKRSGHRGRTEARAHPYQPVERNRTVTPRSITIIDAEGCSAPLNIWTGILAMQINEIH